MDLDRSFISLLVSSDIDTFKYAVKNVPFSFVKGKDKKMYEWIANYYRNTKGHLPSPTALVSAFKGEKLIKTKDKIQYFEVEFKKRHEYIILTNAVTGISDALFKEDVDAARRIYKDVGRKLGEADVQTLTDIKSTLRDRHKSYVINKQNKGKIGYYVGIEAIDKLLGGITTEFFIIMGRQGIGKTFLSLMSMVSIWKEVSKASKKPILIVSNEMPVNNIYGRLDAITAEVNSSQYRKGLLKREDEIKIRDLTNVYESLSPLHVISGAGRSANDIEFDIVAIEPAIVLIDGIYLTDMGKNDFVGDTIAASRAYQRINKKYKIPIIATSQMQDNQTKYARALQEDADVVLALTQNQHMKDADMMKLKFYKVREDDSNVEVMMNWNFDTWTFGQVVKTEDAEDDFQT